MYLFVILLADNLSVGDFHRALCVSSFMMTAMRRRSMQVGWVSSAKNTVYLYALYEDMLRALSSFLYDTAPRRVARVLLKWKHFQAGGLGPPWGPQWVQGEALVGAQGAKPPKATWFYTFTVQISMLIITLSSFFFVYDFYSMILHARR